MTKDEALNIKDFAVSIVNTIHEPLIVLDSELKVILASPAFYQTFKVDPKETIGQFIYDIRQSSMGYPHIAQIAWKRSLFKTYHSINSKLSMSLKILGSERCS